jgi:hypothetical protein
MKHLLNLIKRLLQASRDEYSRWYISRTEAIKENKELNDEERKAQIQEVNDVMDNKSLYSGALLITNNFPFAVASWLIMIGLIVAATYQSVSFGNSLQNSFIQDSVHICSFKTEDGKQLSIYADSESSAFVTYKNWWGKVKPAVKVYLKEFAIQDTSSSKATAYTNTIYLLYASYGSVNVGSSTTEYKASLTTEDLDFLRYVSEEIHRDLKMPYQEEELHERNSQLVKQQKDARLERAKELQNVYSCP